MSSMYASEFYNSGLQYTKYYCEFINKDGKRIVQYTDSYYLFKKFMNKMKRSCLQIVVNSF